MSSLSTALYALSAVALLFVPAIQVKLHWKLSSPDIRYLPRLAALNHGLLLVAVASVAGLYWLVSPEANLRVDLLLAIPLSALIVLLWGMFILRLSRLQG